MATLTMRRTLRLLAGAGRNRSNVPCTVVAGDAKPELTGTSYYCTTLSGKTRINYPSAYRWPMWYHASTIRVEVGASYLAGLAMAQYAEVR